MTRTPRETPIRSSLESGSSLRNGIEDGIRALQRAHRQYLATDIRESFADSLDLDKAMQEDYDQENRWDYLLGHTQSATVIGLEPHSARHDQITTVIQKRAAARQQLRGHLKDGVRVTVWLWVASGRVHFADTERARRRLDQSGIEFVGKRVLKKHLPAAKTASPGRR